MKPLAADCAVAASPGAGASAKEELHTAANANPAGAKRAEHSLDDARGKVQLAHCVVAKVDDVQVAAAIVA